LRCLIWIFASAVSALFHNAFRLLPKIHKLHGHGKFMGATVALSGGL
jgi:hypothetical protein